ncbi:hypothetical protein BH10PSE6_BH10PSE6_20410 [soil metagenome]
MSVKYSAVDDFSILNGNPNGVWTYVSGPSVISGTGAMTTPGSTAELDYWAEDPVDPLGRILKNTTAAPVVVDGTIEVPTDQLGLDPQEGIFAAVVFTAPVDATYVVIATFMGIDTEQVPTQAGIDTSPGQSFFGTIDYYGDIVSFSITLRFHAGDSATIGGGALAFTEHASLGLAVTIYQVVKSNWASAVDGDWDVAANWNPAGVPGDFDRAYIAVAGAYTVTSSADRNLRNLSLTAAGATLAVIDSTFAAQVLTNNGSITVTADIGDAALGMLGTVVNAGSISLTGGGGSQVAQILVGDGALKLKGSGSILLDGTADSASIVGTTPASKFSNGDNFITGAGLIGDDTMDIVNLAAGTISANVDGEVLVIDTSTHLLTNYGEINADNGGILRLTGFVTNGGPDAEICADGTGSTVVLDAAHVTGTFTLHAEAGSSVEVVGFSLIAGKVTLDGAINVDAVANGAATGLVIGGTITNAGTISVTGYWPEDPLDDPLFGVLGVYDGTVTLQGGGSVVLSGGGEATGILGTGFDSYLINVDNTISGEGIIDTDFYNMAGGLVDANVTGEMLAVQSGYLRNAGVMQASNGGILAVSGGLIFTDGGLLKATGAGSQVVLAGGFFDGPAHLVSEDGGTFAAVGPNFVQNGLILDGDLLLDATLYDDFVLLSFEKDLVNNGSITLAGIDEDCGCGPMTAELAVGPGGGALKGGGTITLAGDPSLTMITDDFGPARLVNVDNTIQGAGSIGGNLILFNKAAGVIEANVTGESLVLGSLATTITNQGTFKASNGGTLDVQGDVVRSGGAVISGGTIEFRGGAASAVSFTSGSGVLDLDDSDRFSGTVAGLGGSQNYALDLNDIDFDSIVTTSYTSRRGNTRGVLTISDGVDTANIRLVGAFADNFSLTPPGPGYSGFVLGDDGFNGTSVHYVTG